MKNLFCNLKPFLSYWCVFAVYFVVCLFELIPIHVMAICSIILICILNFITGYTDGVKKDSVGITLFSVQLIIFAILGVFNLSESRIIVFGNLFLSTWFIYSENAITNVLFAVFSVVLPIAPFFIGSLIKNKRIHSELISL